MARINACGAAQPLLGTALQVQASCMKNNNTGGFSFHSGNHWADSVFVANTADTLEGLWWFDGSSEPGSCADEAFVCGLKLRTIYNNFALLCRQISPSFSDKVFPLLIHV